MESAGDASRGCPTEVAEVFLADMVVTAAAERTGDRRPATPIATST